MIQKRRGRKGEGGDSGRFLTQQTIANPSLASRFLLTTEADVSKLSTEGKGSEYDTKEEETTSKKPTVAVDDIEGCEELQMSFPERLMDLLQNGKDVERAMKWLPSGEGFTIVPSIFYDVVLDGHFHGTKFESFTRKLNRW